MQRSRHSVIRLVRLARPHLIRSKGEIINVSSIAGLNFASELAPYYAISKAGLDQLTRSLAVDLIGHGVRVNGVSEAQDIYNLEICALRSVETVLKKLVGCIV
ncbi:unnamed protein product [Heligmosomoides polygyrus]|uniref:SDR family oxidoreductase n=1 Tax=Heligmosomoides polygyrus TaxID=6339 RepID=A0A183GXB8_HELPZ|nr:unnamed protein product [Heligmosomoides polygyrus]